jgi:hypothetical protein
MYKCNCDLKAGKLHDKEFDSSQLEIGIEVEKEHTDDVSIAKQIAKAHLLENKDYYRLLTRCGL